MAMGLPCPATTRDATWQGGARDAILTAVPPLRSARCPTCRRETAWEGNRWRPFCSERCKVIDLAAWADERYRIPGDPVPSEPDPDGERR